MSPLRPCANTQSSELPYVVRLAVAKSPSSLEDGGTRSRLHTFSGSSFISLWGCGLNCYFHLRLLLNHRFSQGTLALVLVDSLLTRHMWFQSEHDFNLICTLATLPKSTFSLHIISLLAQTLYHPALRVTIQVLSHASTLNLRGAI